MAWHISVDGADVVASRMDSINSNLKKRMEEAMAISVRDIQERARSTHRFTTRTGEAERSIEAEVTGSGTSLHGTVGTTRLITIYLHQGTRPHDIEPRSKKVLRWTSGGKFVFAKRAHNPGIKKDPFIFNAADAEADNIRARFDAAMNDLDT